jgi:hypothetical protein
MVFVLIARQPMIELTHPASDFPFQAIDGLLRKNFIDKAVCSMHR